MQYSEEKTKLSIFVDAIIFDFDGVLLESNHIRTEGFRKLLKRNQFPNEKVEQLILYHEANGGLSRYFKLKYFFKEILRKDINDSQLLSLCNEYSVLVKQRVAKAQWVEGAYGFLSKNYDKYKFFIVSASDQDELREICNIRKIEKYFTEILGSPADKKTNIAYLLTEYGILPENALFVGDSINDLKAAQSVNVNFVARDSGSCGEWAKNLIVIKDLTRLSSCLSK